jgi:very-short-patch-repair endonuclease
MARMPPFSMQLDRLVQKQHGLASNQQLLALEWTRAQIEHARTTQLLVDVHHEVYRFAGAPFTYRSKLAAACLAAGPEAAVSHRASAHLWTVRQREGPVEIEVPYERCPIPKGVILHRSTDLVPEHVTHRDGIPVTIPARTIVDLGAVVSVGELATTADAAVLKGLTTWPQIYEMRDAVARRGRRGVGKLRLVLADRPFGGRAIESVLEPVMGRIIRDYGIDGVEYQYEVVVNGKVYRIDFAVPHVKFGIEVDGIEWHGTRDAAIRDRERRRALRAAGWEIAEYTATEMHRRPGGVASEILRRIKEREPFFVARTC